MAAWSLAVAAVGSGAPQEPQEPLWRLGGHSGPRSAPRPVAAEGGPPARVEPSGRKPNAAGVVVLAAAAVAAWSLAAPGDAETVYRPPEFPPPPSALPPPATTLPLPPEMTALPEHPPPEAEPSPEPVVRSGGRTAPSGPGDWTTMVRRRYALWPATVERVEGWRPLVAEAMGRSGLGGRVEEALAVMACESGGLDIPGGLFQFVASTWAGYGFEGRGWDRRVPAENVAAMAEVVSRRGWQDWIGGPWRGGTWGTGPLGNGCW